MGLGGGNLPSEHEGIVFVTLSIDVDGRPIGCAVAKTSGFRSLDDKTCAVLIRHARFEPARDDDGTRVASSYGASMRWSFYSASSPGYLLDMAVEVGRLPAGATRPVTAVRQLIAADGTLEGCAIEQTSGYPGLDRLACKQAEPLAKLGPVKDAFGKPTRTMRVSRLLFVEGARRE